MGSPNAIATAARALLDSSGATHAIATGSGGIPYRAGAVPTGHIFTADASGNLVDGGAVPSGATPAGSNGNVQLTDGSGALVVGTYPLTVNRTTGAVMSRNNTLDDGSGGASFTGAVFAVKTSANNSGAPALMGFTGSNGKSRHQYDDIYSGIQGGAGEGLQAYSYWGMSFEGLRQDSFPAFGGNRSQQHVYIPLAQPGATGVVVKAATSQTANVQEWQSSGGTPLAYVTAAGNVTANTKTVIGNVGASTQGIAIHKNTSRVSVVDFLGDNGAGGEETIFSITFDANDPDFLNVSDGTINLVRITSSGAVLFRDVADATEPGENAKEIRYGTDTNRLVQWTGAAWIAAA